MDTLFAKIREWKIAILLFIAAIAFSGLSLGAAGSIVLENQKTANAQALIPFGGIILYTQFCTCSFNLLVTIGPPVGGTFVFQPGVSILFPFFQIFRPGPWTVGGWTPGGVCTIYVGLGCAPIPVQGTIGVVGTSL